jgi:hypothetical protein
MLAFGSLGVLFKQLCSGGEVWVSLKKGGRGGIFDVVGGGGGGGGEVQTNFSTN